MDTHSQLICGRKRHLLFSSSHISKKETSLFPTLLLYCCKVTDISTVSPREEHQMWLLLASIISLTVGQTQIAAFLMVKNPCFPQMPDIRCLGESFIISHFVIRFEV